MNVTINGRQFRMACEDGQEGHLQQLARELDERIVALRGQFGEIGDARLTVMAALMVADELAETAQEAKAAGGRARGSAGCARGAASTARRPPRRPSPRPSTRRPSGSKASPRSSARPAAPATDRRTRLNCAAVSRDGWQWPPSALHWPGGAVGCVRDTFPGALRSRRELSLAGTLVSVIWRPPTYVGSRDHAPTAIAAPHFLLPSGNGLQAC